VNLIQWAQSPWGQQVPTHIAWILLWVSAIGGLLFLVVHAVYVKFFAKPAAAHASEGALTASGARFAQACDAIHKGAAAAVPSGRVAPSVW